MRGRERERERERERKREKEKEKESWTKKDCIKVLVGEPVPVMQHTRCSLPRGSVYGD